jgi:hypothetical protein
VKYAAPLPLYSIIVDISHYEKGEKLTDYCNEWGVATEADRIEDGEDGLKGRGGLRRYVDYDGMGICFCDYWD